MSISSIKPIDPFSNNTYLVPTIGSKTTLIKEIADPKKIIA